jgi:hypothetical protein
MAQLEHAHELHVMRQDLSQLILLGWLPGPSMQPDISTKHRCSCQTNHQLLIVTA